MIRNYSGDISPLEYLCTKVGIKKNHKLYDMVHFYEFDACGRGVTDSVILYLSRYGLRIGMSKSEFEAVRNKWVNKK